MLKIIKIFLLGIIILAGAIILNTLASRIGLLNWYDFLETPSKADHISYLWLFIIYPMILGVIAYLTSKLLHF